MIKKFWNDPVWSKVIATAVIAVVTFFFAGRQLIWQILKSIYAFINFHLSIPIWLLILSFPVLLFLIPGISIFKKRKMPAFVSYKGDSIFDINWFWDWSPPSYYNEYKYSIKNLIPRCPSCHSLLELNDYSGTLINCINEKCNWEWSRNKSFDKRITHTRELTSKVLNEIDRRICSGEKGAT